MRQPCNPKQGPLPRLATALVSCQENTKKSNDVFQSLLFWFARHGHNLTGESPERGLIAASHLGQQNSPMHCFLFERLSCVFQRRLHLDSPFVCLFSKNSLPVHGKQRFFEHFPHTMWIAGFSNHHLSIKTLHRKKCMFSLVVKSVCWRVENGRRHLATAMSRRDNSSVGDGDGVCSLKPEELYRESL